MGDLSLLYLIYRGQAGQESTRKLRRPEGMDTNDKKKLRKPKME